MSNPFREVFHLGHSVAIYVPSTTDVNKQADNAQWVDKVQSTLSELFGGNTAHNASGAWMSPDFGLVREDVVICQSFADDLTDDNLQTVYDLANLVKSGMSQEAVSVEIDGTLYLV